MDSAKEPGRRAGARVAARTAEQVLHLSNNRHHHRCAFLPRDVQKGNASVASKAGAKLAIVAPCYYMEGGTPGGIMMSDRDRDQGLGNDRDRDKRDDSYEDLQKSPKREEDTLPDRDEPPPQK